jgi:hypothetical protein
MTGKRLLLPLIPLAWLAACNDAPAEEGRAATGEVLEGSISDAMLPVDRVTSEPPLEDPEAFAEVQQEAAERAPSAAAPSAEGEAAEPAAGAPEEAPVAEPAAEAEAE